MKPDRLLVTPDHELELAMTRTIQGKFYSLSSVYAIGNEANGLIKIGYADNLKHRFSGLNSGSPVPLKLVHFVHVVDSVVAKLVEGQAHRILDIHRVKGEWFDVSSTQAAEAIGIALATNRVRWWTEYERRKMASYVAKTVARHEQHQRIFGA